MKLTQRLSQSRPLYDAFKQIREGDTWGSLSEAQQRVVEGELRDFVLGGVALEVCICTASLLCWGDADTLICRLAWVRMDQLLSVFGSSF